MNLKLKWFIIGAIIALIFLFYNQARASEITVTYYPEPTLGPVQSTSRSENYKIEIYKLEWK